VQCALTRGKIGLSMTPNLTGRRSESADQEESRLCVTGLLRPNQGRWQRQGTANFEGSTADIFRQLREKLTLQHFGRQHLTWFDSVMYHPKSQVARPKVGRESDVCNTLYKKMVSAILSSALYGSLKTEITTANGSVKGLSLDIKHLAILPIQRQQLLMLPRFYYDAGLHAPGSFVVSTWRQSE
jgi:hypothetical protein